MPWTRTVPQGESMNLSHRSKLSLCQFLTLFPTDDLILLLGKYGFSTNELESQWSDLNTATALRRAIPPASDSQFEGLVQELAKTCGSMRAGVSPRYRFDERWNDLCLCLELDGYAKERNECGIERFVPIEPIIEGVTAVEDDLTKELRRAGLPDIEGIIQVLNSSASTFRDNDFNGCLNERD